MVLQQCRNYLYEAHLGSIHSSIYERWWWGCLGCLGATKASETYVTVESRASSCRSVVRFHVLRVVVHVAHARFAANHIARRRVTFIRRCRPVIVHERISFRSVIFQKKKRWTCIIETCTVLCTARHWAIADYCSNLL